MSYRHRLPCGSAAIFACALALILLPALSDCAVAQFYHEWNGGTGSWSNQLNWSTGSVPDSGTVDIGYVSGGIGDVTLASFDPTIDNLFIGSNARLTVESSLAVNSLIENEGELSVAGEFAFFDPFNNGRNFRLEGGGNIQLNGGELRVGNVGLVNENISIRGFGVPEPKAGLLMLGGFVVLMFLSQRR